MKQKKKTIPSPASIKKTPVLQPVFPWYFKVKCYIILVLGFLFYANTLANKYALDDSIAIERNTHVQKGISGIGQILTHDSYDSFYKEMGGDPNKQYSGGRYRPLSLVTFAIEQSLFKKSYLPFIRHLVNVLSFLLCLITIFFFLNNYLLKKLPGGGDIAFLSVILFAIHPIHTEVVANIKSLDEILSLTLIMGTFIFSLEYLNNKKTKYLIGGMLCYFLAMLAKEYAITLIILLPLLFYILTNEKTDKIIISSLPYYAVFIAYLLMRFHAVGVPHSTPANDPMVDPFLYATGSQKLATECYALGRYMGMLFFPWPLSCDYSYAQIHYRNFSDISVLLSIIIYAAITIWAFKELRKRSVMALLLFLFLGCIALISNFVIGLGAILGERLLFHSSLAFLVILSIYILKFLNRIPLEQRKKIVMGCLIGLTVICGAVVLPRNAQWKNDDSLFIHDVNVCPNSALLNNNAGWCYIGLSESPANKPEQAVAYLDSAKKYLYKAMAVHKNYAECFANVATVYFHFGLPDSAKQYLDAVKHIYPQYPSLPRISGFVADLYMNTALRLGGEHKPYEAINDLKKGLELSPDSANLWYNLGGAYYTLQKYDSARYAWKNTLKLKPGYTEARKGLQALPAIDSTSIKQ